MYSEVWYFWRNRVCSLLWGQLEGTNRQRLLRKSKRGTFHPGTSLSNPPFEAEVTRVTKKREVCTLKVLTEVKGRRKDWSKENARETVEGIAFGGERGADIGPCVSAVVSVTDLWCGNNSRWGLGPVRWNYVWLWWAVVEHTHIFSDSLSQAVFLVSYSIETELESCIAWVLRYSYPSS